jgi:SAM-dependent methyltransferase
VAEPLSGEESDPEAYGGARPVAGNPRTDARRQAVKRSQATPAKVEPSPLPVAPGREAARLTPLTCWTCGERLRLLGEVLACPLGHPVAETEEGVYDLWPPDREQPAIDTYGTPFGWAYDMGVNTRALARVTARWEWGTDIRRMYGLMDEGLRLARGQVALDVPVGGGTTFAEGAPDLKGLLVGVDLSPVMLGRAAVRRETTGLTRQIVLARGDATRLPLAAAGVDRVLCFNGLHVIPDKEAAMAEFRRVLKPGGELLGTVLVADGRAPFSAIVALERLASFFVPTTTGELRSLATRFGFSRWEQEADGALLYFRGQ